MKTPNYTLKGNNTPTRKRRRVYIVTTTTETRTSAGTGKRVVALEVVEWESPTTSSST